jgi:hypothetical protein
MICPANPKERIPVPKEFAAVIALGVSACPAWAHHSFSAAQSRFAEF